MSIIEIAYNLVGKERLPKTTKNGTISATWTWVDENNVPHTATSRYSSINMLWDLGRRV
jgi:hypothetical protein